MPRKGNKVSKFSIHIQTWIDPRYLGTIIKHIQKTNGRYTSLAELTRDVIESYAGIIIGNGGESVTSLDEAVALIDAPMAHSMYSEEEEDREKEILDAKMEEEFHSILKRIKSDTPIPKPDILVADLLGDEILSEKELSNLITDHTREEKIAKLKQLMKEIKSYTNRDLTKQERGELDLLYAEQISLSKSLGLVK